MRNRLAKLAVVGMAIVAMAALAVGVFRIGTSQSATVPSWISYQGRLTQPNGNLVPDGSYAAIFRVFDAPTAGNELWSESQSIGVKQGVFTASLGKATPFPPDLFRQLLWVETTIDGKLLTPRQELAAVPFAMTAQEARSLPAGTVDASMIANGAITTEKLADGSVTTQKLAADALKMAVYSASGPNPAYWVVPQVGWHPIPGLSLSVVCPTQSYLDVSFTGLVTTRATGSALYTNIAINGNHTSASSGEPLFGGYRNSGGPDTFANAANQVLVPVPAGTHLVQVRATTDAAPNDAKVHSGFVRVLVIPR